MIRWSKLLSRRPPQSVLLSRAWSRALSGSATPLDSFDLIEQDESRTRIDGYDKTGFLINDIHFVGDIIALPQTAFIWDLSDKSHEKQHGTFDEVTTIPRATVDQIRPHTLAFLEVLLPKTGMLTFEVLIFPLKNESCRYSYCWDRGHSCASAGGFSTVSQKAFNRIGDHGIGKNRMLL